MPDNKRRLIALLNLAAAGGADTRLRVIEELTDLLLDWPEDIALRLRAWFDLLLAKLAEDAPPEMRAMLGRRFAARPDPPIALLNRVFLDATGDVKRAILRRNALAHEGPVLIDVVAVEAEARLVAAARGEGDLTGAFAWAVGIDQALAMHILAEPDGAALAAACKGAYLKRTTFSMLALFLAGNDEGSERRLEAYDAVPQAGAESLVQFWQLRCDCQAALAEDRASTQDRAA